MSKTKTIKMLAAKMCAGFSRSAHHTTTNLYLTHADNSQPKNTILLTYGIYHYTYILALKIRTELNRMGCNDNGKIE